MPKIPEFDAGNVRLQPSETGIEATAQSARRVGAFYNQQAGAEEKLARETDRLGAETSELGSFKGNLLTGEGSRLGSAVAAAGDATVKYLDHRQISQGAASYAGLLQQATADWNNTAKNADPNDGTIASSFMGRLQPMLDQFKGAFYTEGAQQWAEAHADALRTHFAEKTQADMSTLSGQAAIVNQQRTVNSLSSTVHDDPQSVNFAMEALKSSTEGVLSTSPNLTAAEAGRVRGEILQKGAESIVKSAAIGYISKTGQVPDWISDPKYSPYVNGKELELFAKQARVQQRVDAAAQKQEIETTKRLEDMAVHTDMNKNFTDNVKWDPTTSRPIIDSKFYQNALDIVRAHPNAPSAAVTAKAYLDWGESQQRAHAEPIVSDPGVHNDLISRMFSADKPTSRIEVLQAEADHKLSAHDATTLREMVTELEQTPLKGPMWEDTMKAAHAALTYSMPGMPGKDPKGEQAFASFVQQFIPDYLGKSRGGTLPPGSLDMNNPESLISKSMAQFRRSPAQLLQDRISELGGIAAPASGTAPAPAAPPKVTLPPTSERKAGQTYDTPRGKMKWTGTGWVSP